MGNNSNTQLHPSAWQHVTCSSDYNYVVLKNDGGDLRVYDISKEKPQSVLHMIADNKAGSVTGAVVYGLQLYYTREGKAVIYEKTLSCNGEQTYMEIENCESVEVVDVVRGNGNFILKTHNSQQYGGALVMYDRDNNSISKLPLQEDYSDCVQREGTSDCYIVATDSRSCAVYEDDLDRLYIDAGKFDLHTLDINAYIGAVSMEDFDDFKIFPSSDGDMNWPLINLNHHIPRARSFSRYGNFLVSSRQDQFIFISEPNGNIYRVLDMSVFNDVKEDNLIGIFFDEREESLLLVTNTTISKYRVPRVPEAVLTEFNELYGNIQYRSTYGDEAKRDKLQNLFYKILYAHGQPNKIYEVGI